MSIAGTPSYPDVTAPQASPTTLYDLMAAIQANVDPDDDDLVVATMVHMLHAGRVRWLSVMKRLSLAEPGCGSVPHRQAH